MDDGERFIEDLRMQIREDEAEKRVARQAGRYFGVALGLALAALTGVIGLFLRG